MLQYKEKQVINFCCKIPRFILQCLLLLYNEDNGACILSASEMHSFSRYIHVQELLYYYPVNLTAKGMKHFLMCVTTDFISPDCHNAETFF